MRDWVAGFHGWIGSGLEPKDFTLFQIALRGVIVFIVTLIMVRLADRRVFAKKAAFDIVLGFILASMLARAVNGSSAFFPTLGGGFVLIGLHRLLGAIAFRYHWFSILVKGTEDVLIEQGKMKAEVMRKTHITEDDLREDLRLRGKIEDPGEVEKARLERSGKISVIPRK
ncbi:MAG: putative rane protein [Pedosphaera sp.]|nr:putative rane protein [Pedosphaera sp.]